MNPKKTPVVMQMEGSECGAACLTMVLAYHGRIVPLEQIRYDCGVSRDGVNVKNICDAARAYGLNPRPFAVGMNKIKSQNSYPCIIYWNFNHFVVLKGFTQRHALINDPAIGAVKVPIDEFDKAYAGICIFFELTDAFEKGGHKPAPVEYLKSGASKVRAAMIFVVLTTILAGIFSIMQPALSRAFYDKILDGGYRIWLVPFIVVLSAVSLLNVAMEFFSVCYRSKINAKADAAGSAGFMWKILKLPMSFFSQRMGGDIISRKSSNSAASKILINTVAPLFLEGVVMIVYLIVMLEYNVTLALIALVSVILNTIIARIISQKRVNITRSLIRDRGRLASGTMVGIKMAESIKASGAESGFFGLWAQMQATANAGVQKTVSLNFYLGILPTVVSSVTTILITGIGCYLVIKGSFTIGAITAFLGFLNGFTTPAQKMISAGQSIQEMETEISRIGDVMNYPDDQAFSAIELSEDEIPVPLSGDIEISHVTFGYSINKEPLIKDFSLSVKRGEKIAIVGGSGSGKSTIAKLVSGLFIPWEGSITFDGKTKQEIDRDVFTSCLTVVDQNIVLFDDTIENNITMWDSSVSEVEMIEAAKMAHIHDDIMRKPGGYQHKLLENGKDFSGGQRQRIEIARALAQKPGIIIMDEATSALDAKTEKEIMDSVSACGITSIIIAHRLSAVRDCDRIIVLDKGIEVERGTHEELMMNNGPYAALVNNE